MSLSSAASANGTQPRRRQYSNDRRNEYPGPLSRARLGRFEFNNQPVQVTADNYIRSPYLPFLPPRPLNFREITGFVVKHISCYRPHGRPAMHTFCPLQMIVEWDDGFNVVVTHDWEHELQETMPSAVYQYWQDQGPRHFVIPQDQWLVFRVLGDRWNSVCEREEYLVQWVGFPETEALWETAEKIESMDKVKVQEYWRQKRESSV
ncbi:hypothetical protein FDECE_8706 [Fusarium decemcellulare]|nr:hypothetical protein FDECE_8706 [Fusarium decemcellulare]